MNIPKEYTTFFLDLNAVQVLDEDATRAFGGNLTLAYNLAPIIGITQTFLDIDIWFGVPLASYTDVAIKGKTGSFLYSWYLSITKKLGFGRSNLGIGLGGGLDALTMTGTLFDDTFVYSLKSVGFKISTDFEFLINQDFSINIGTGLKIGLAPSRVALTWAGEQIFTYSGEEVTEIYPELFLGGWNFTVGINYALGELPINIFGFLDPLKKH